MITKRNERRAAKRTRRTLNRILPLVKAIGADLAAEALAMIAANEPPEEVARRVAGRLSRA